MKHFIIKLILFLLPVLLIVTALELYTRTYDTIMKQKRMQLEAGSDSIKLLILGNSHAGDGLAPTAFDMYAFNTAQGFQPLYFDIEITKKYLPRLTQLKYVLISIDYHSLYITHEPARDFMYAYYYGLDYPGGSFVKSNISLLFNGYGFKNGLSMILKPPFKLVKGWTGFKKTNYDDLTNENGKRRVGVFDKMMQEDPQARMKTLLQLNSFISLLQSKNIVPVIVTLPCHQYYTSHLNATLVAQNNSDINNLCNRYHIRHFNYLNLKFPDEYFYNADHLNEKGAFKIGRMLNDTIKACYPQY